MKERRIGVLMGGWSSEREISLLSGENVYRSLKRQGFDVVAIDINKDFAKQIEQTRIEVAFVILHGKPGEDGTIQGYLELCDIPYTGSGLLASAIGMDKIMTKRIFLSLNIPTPPFYVLPAGCELSSEVDKAYRDLGLPLVLKPRSEGSSVGVEIVKNRDELFERCRLSQEKFGDIFLEKYLHGMIATVGILGERVLPILELVPKHEEFYDYKAKYTKGETEFIIPARLEKEVYERTGELSLKAHRAIGAEGFSRVDLVIEDGRDPSVLEVNTIPGMTEISDLPAQAAFAGISYDELVLEILKSGVERREGR